MTNTGDGSSEDIQFFGFERTDITQSKYHMRKFDEEGVIFTGYRNSKDWSSHRQQDRDMSFPRTKPTEIISLLSDEEDEAPAPAPSTSATVPLRQSNLKSATAPVVQKAEGGSSARKHVSVSRRVPWLPSASSQLVPPSRSSASREIHIIESSDEDSPPLTLDGCPVVQVDPTHPAHPDAENSEEEYSVIHSALDLNVESNWTGRGGGKSVIDIQSNNLPDVAALTISPSSHKISVCSSQTYSSIHYEDMGLLGNTDSCVSPSLVEEFIWTQICSSHSLIPVAKRNDTLSTLLSLQSTNTIPYAPGAIQKITQSGGLIAIASSVWNGGMEDGEAGPYNSGGALKVLVEGECYILPAHEDQADMTQGRMMVLISITNFNPACPLTLVSAGTDRALQIWDCESVLDGKGPQLMETSNILFKPGEPLLAMGGWDGCIYLSPITLKTRGKACLYLAPEIEHEVADLAWGHSATSNLLFASSCPIVSRMMDDYSGHHKAFDTLTDQVVCTFSVSESGEQIALNDAGTTLAMATHSSESLSSLWLFDCQHLLSDPVCKIDLEPSTSNIISQVSFSTGGIYLAVARADNTVVVYDSRFLSREPLHVFTHNQGTLTSTGDFGVVGSYWIEGLRGTRLVTGGADGCVRLWDVRTASDDPLNGTAIVQCEYDIGYFTLGDLSRGEKPLVV
ncbi:uncharacterized protein FIBRA_02972 [Fibroporia radiculosa]|uniref:Uncharacterized protein n=1 Tax=Fibroporia radiculosa TaxID=599839 RepID=J4GN80_9APHY|nr:uncharacterized protein FIBRA_02972 [Fibroporia radiculosa]CCM00925.1 predicted protein [Fibroporia radiculosa]